MVASQNISRSRPAPGPAQPAVMQARPQPARQPVKEARRWRMINWAIYPHGIRHLIAFGLPTQFGFALEDDCMDLMLTGQLAQQVETAQSSPALDWQQFVMTDGEDSGHKNSVSS